MFRSKYVQLCYLSAVVFLLAACNTSYQPKPKGYFKIDFPQHQYQSFTEKGFPYQFEYPTYAKVVKDTTFFEDKPENPYWINIDFPQFNGRIYLSYKSLQQNSFEKMVNDAYKMTFKHTYKATSIKDSVMYTPKGVSGVYFVVGGDAATGQQFFLTDSNRHFIRGALYFDATPNADSLGIVMHFLAKDMQHLINSLAWNNQ